MKGFINGGVMIYETSNAQPAHLIASFLGGEKLRCYTYCMKTFKLETELYMLSLSKQLPIFHMQQGTTEPLAMSYPTGVNCLLSTSQVDTNNLVITPSMPISVVVNPFYILIQPRLLYLNSYLQLYSYRTSIVRCSHTYILH